MTPTAPARNPEAITFYSAARPLVEQLDAMAEAWLASAPNDPMAAQAYSEFGWLAIRVRLRLSLCRSEGEEP